VLRAGILLAYNRGKYEAAADQEGVTILTGGRMRRSFPLGPAGSET